MQFGIGLLGAGWSLEGAIERQLANALPPGKNFHLHAGCYAAKIAAETVLSERPRIPDLSNDGIVIQCAGCARPVRPSEAPMVRDAFLAVYSGYLKEVA